jgi:lysophospholipase L1-like esterase
VSFFDSTNAYLEDPNAPTAELKINENLMDDFFHLTKNGYQLWASLASEKLQKMLDMPYRNSTQETNQDDDW